MKSTNIRHGPSQQIIFRTMFVQSHNSSIRYFLLLSMILWLAKRRVTGKNFIYFIQLRSVVASNEEKYIITNIFGNCISLARHLAGVEQKFSTWSEFIESHRVEKPL